MYVDMRVLFLPLFFFFFFFLFRTDVQVGTTGGCFGDPPTYLDTSVREAAVTWHGMAWRGVA